MTQQISVLYLIDGYTFFIERCKINVMTVHYAQISAHLKIPPYSTHSDNCSLAIKFNTLSLSMFYLFSISFVCRGEGHLQITDSD